MQVKAGLTGAMLLATAMLLTTAVLAKPGTKTPGNTAPAVTVSMVSTTEVFPGDEVTIQGTGLDDKKVKFLIGKKMLKVVSRTPNQATVKIPGRLKTGLLSFKVGKTKTETTFQFTMFQIPKLRKVPNAVPRGGTLQIRGAGLDGVTGWKLGPVSLTVDDSVKNSSKLVTLKVPPNAPGEGVLAANVNGRDFPFKTAIKTGVAPVIEWAMVLDSVERGYKMFGIAGGQGFTKDTTLKVAKKSVEVEAEQMKGERAVAFRTKRRIPKRTFTLVAANGPFESAPFEVDAKKLGFSTSEDDLAAAIFREPPDLPLAQIERELELIQARVEKRCNGLQAMKQSGSAKTAAMAKATGDCTTGFLEAMMWVRYYQGALCRTMGAGTDAAVSNAEAGRLLRKISSELHDVPRKRLAEMWREVTAPMLKGGALKKMRMKDAINHMEKLWESRDYASVSCRDKFFGESRKSAAETVNFDLEAAFRTSFPVAFDKLSTSVSDDAKFERALKKILKPASREMQSFWHNIIVATWRKKEAAPPARPKGPIRLID